MTPPGATTWAPSLTPEIMLEAYAQGIFPMSEGVDDPEVFWIDPRRRGILPLDGFHLSRSLAGTIRRGRFRATVDRAFADVVAGCADRPETWINAPIAEITLTLHERGQAHSVEVWDGDALVGGIYGVALGAAFFGESMFSRVRDASKVALATLVERLVAGGFVLLDTQFLTPHLASLGGIEVSRDRYRRMLAQALTLEAAFAGPVPGPEAMLAALRGPPLPPSP